MNAYAVDNNEIFVQHIIDLQVLFCARYGPEKTPIAQAAELIS